MHVGLVYFFHRWLRFCISHDAVGSIAAVAVMALTMVAGVMLLLMPAISSCQGPPLHSEGSFTGGNLEAGFEAFFKRHLQVHRLTWFIIHSKRATPLVILISFSFFLIFLHSSFHFSDRPEIAMPVKTFVFSTLSH
mgnify:CR=1 FL=1